MLKNIFFQYRHKKLKIMDFISQVVSTFENIVKNDKYANDLKLAMYSASINSYISGGISKLKSEYMQTILVTGNARLSKSKLEYFDNAIVGANKIIDSIVGRYNDGTSSDRSLTTSLLRELVILGRMKDFKNVQHIISHKTQGSKIIIKYDHDLKMLEALEISFIYKNIYKIIQTVIDIIENLWINGFIHCGICPTTIEYSNNSSRFVLTTFEHAIPIIGYSDKIKCQTVGEKFPKTPEELNKLQLWNLFLSLIYQTNTVRVIDTSYDTTNIVKYLKNIGECSDDMIKTLVMIKKFIGKPSKPGMSIKKFDLSTLTNYSIYKSIIKELSDRKLHYKSLILTFVLSEHQEFNVNDSKDIRAYYNDIGKTTTTIMKYLHGCDSYELPFSCERDLIIVSTEMSINELDDAEICKFIKNHLI